MMRRVSLRPPSRSPSRRQSMVKGIVQHNTSLYTSSLVFGIVAQKPRRKDIDFGDLFDGKLRFYRNPMTITDQIGSIMNKICEGRVEEESEYRRYNAKKCKILCQLLAQDIKRAVKGMGMRRYRIVTMVSIFPKYQQGITCAMLFFQDPSVDLFSNHKYETPTFFILSTVYLIYKD
ncbi:dynein light chain Tctex-type 5-like [Lutzomyia longipalpis]|uniref:dynein light chain Tctex-type 5-like n=1 Tax=Lutzomyia longipalpis TaxID=7200 RepID=UPI002483E1D7|nr:dynein light chain Tctex-type 5-like [Lutzomyia longipalpis]